VVGTNEEPAETGPGEALFHLIAEDLDLLARLHDRELDATALAGLLAAPPENWFSFPPTGEETEAGFALLRDACKTIRKYPEQEVLDDLAADFSALYLTHTHRASPNESVWMTEEKLERQEPMFAVRGWYEHYNLKAPNWRTRSDDHLVNQIVFLAELLRRETQASLCDAGRFLDQHLNNWIGEFAIQAANNCQTPFYAGLALITHTYVSQLRDILEEVTGEARKPLLGVPSENTADPQESPAYIPGAQPSW